MHNTVFAKIAESKSQLAAYIFPIQIRVCFYMVLECSAFTKFSDDVAVVWGIENILKVEQIWMIYFSEDFDLVLEQFFFGFV